MSDMDDFDAVTHDNGLEIPKRTRRNFGRGEEPDRSPDVVQDTILGRPVVRVELCGRVAEGLLPEDRHMILDEDVWEWLRGVEEWWGLATGGETMFVARGTSAMKAFAGQAPDSHPNASLGRIIMNAKEGEVVLLMNGNPRDLRKENLELTSSRAVAAAFRGIAKSFDRLLKEEAIG